MQGEVHLIVMAFYWGRYSTHILGVYMPLATRLAIIIRCVLINHQLPHQRAGNISYIPPCLCTSQVLGIVMNVGLQVGDIWEKPWSKTNK